MSKIVMYAHGGSGNHGCEAIVRSTCKVCEGLTEKILLTSLQAGEDYRYGINELCEIREAKKPYSKKTRDFLKAYWNLKIKKNYYAMDKMPYRHILQEVNSDDIALSIGGDNYCYENVKEYQLLHDLYLEKTCNTVLWGCSVEPSVLENKEIAEDIKSYALITARESISYEALKKVNPNTKLVADPAFLLDVSGEVMDLEFFDQDVVGINISPMIVNNEKVSGIAIQNYIKLMEYILESTDMNIALIPHVIWEFSDDRDVLNELKNVFEKNDRVKLFTDTDCEKIKKYISQCRFFIGARTHATIAAYSTCVPTLVVGYSVKARGIAKDLFGTDENYVVPVQSLQNENDLEKSFKWLLEHGDSIRKNLEKIMPEYKERALSARKKLQELLDRKK